MFALLQSFVAESNRIEGIYGKARIQQEATATEHFLGLASLSVAEVEQLVSVYQPNARLRIKEGLNVRVGDHIALEGGPRIKKVLEGILEDASRGIGTPYSIHCEYETLHPFTDGNGRSGRAIWLWMVLQHNDWPELGFLHTFYYQTLAAL